MMNLDVVAYATYKESSICSFSVATDQDVSNEIAGFYNNLIADHVTNS